MDSPALDTSEEPKLPLIIVMLNEEKAFTKCIQPLKNHGYDVMMSKRFYDTLKILENNIPKVILLSWTMKRLNVKLLYKLFSEKLKIPCILFAEDSSTKTALGLMHSGIKNHILAPVSGGNIYTKIDAILNKKQEKDEKLLDDQKLIIVTPGRIPRDTAWEAVVDTTFQIEGQTVWKGVFHDKQKNTKKMFYFKGADKPDYDSGLQKWKGLEQASTPIVMQERPQSEAFMMMQTAFESKLLTAFQSGNLSKEFELIQKDDELDAPMTPEAWQKALEELKTNYPDITSEAQIDYADSEPEVQKSDEEDSGLMMSERAQDKGGLHLNPKSVTPGGLNLIKSEKEDEETHIEKESSQKIMKSAGHFNILEKAMHEALKKMAQECEAPAITLGFKEVSIYLLSTPRYMGYLYFSCNEVNAQSVAQDYFQNLIQRLAALGEKAKEVSGPIAIPTEMDGLIENPSKNVMFSIWGENNGFFYTSQFVEDAYPITKEGHTEEAKGFLAISLDDLMPDTRVLFDVYLDMEANKKMLCYLKPGIFEKNRYEKLVNKQVKEVYIKADQQYLFLAYCGYLRLKKTEG